MQKLIGGSNVKFIPISEPFFTGKEKKYLDEAIDSGWISSQGPFVGEFEGKFAKWVGTRHATSCSNGTAALHLALLGLGIGKGDEVILTSHTFVAVPNMVRLAGAEPVFVDIRRDTWNMDEAKIEEKITPRTKAILVVHYYGCPAEMDMAREIADRHGLFIIEDCAEAHGARYKGKTVGTFGDVSAFSFYGNKIITTGEGGMVCSDDSLLIDKITLYKNHGMEKERPYWHEVFGFNYRMTNMQAAVGLGQLDGIGEILRRRRKIFDSYRKGLSQIGGIGLQRCTKNAQCADWLFTAVVEQEFGKSRDELRKVLTSIGIDCRRVHYAFTELPIYREKHNESEFRNAVWFSSAGFSLPSSAGLALEDVGYIINCIGRLKDSASHP